MARRRRNKIVLLPNPPMLNSESAEDFDALREAIELEIKPAGFIEHMYVADVSSIIWDIMRLRRCKGFIIDTAFRAALGHLLMQLLRKPHQLDYEVKEEAEELALRWFSEPEVKKQVSKILAQFELDESAIEAEAFRRSSADLELIERLLASLETRRDRALRCIDEYRHGLARRLQESADRIMQSQRILRLGDSSGQASSAA